MRQESAEDIHAPIIGDQLQDIFDVEPSSEPCQEITGPLYPFGHVLDLKKFV